MKKYLSYREFVPYAPEEVGSIRINHTSTTCTGDSKSLKIERKENGDINAICFRCGLSGYYSETKPRHRKTTPYTSSVDGRDRDYHCDSSPVLPRDATYDASEWSHEAREWLHKYGIIQQDLQRGRVSYSKTRGGIIFPVWEEEGLVGYQIRTTDREDLPKYITYTNQGDRMWFKPQVGKEVLSSPHRNLMLVEDALSAIKVSRWIPSIALMGTDLKRSLYRYIINNNIYNIYIYLDNDNPLVRKKQLMLKRALDGWANSVYPVWKHTDPKALSDYQIQEILKND